ncbi:hypothetical protein B0H11DRAFT_2202331 [Mycena galericulata]|nr:hypothetical protein B0H11DRAFT_2202331 [Mycena galericulata]
MVGTGRGEDEAAEALRVGEGRNGNGKAETTIRSGEALTHFNKCVVLFFSFFSSPDLARLSLPLAMGTLRTDGRLAHDHARRVQEGSSVFPSSSSSLPITSAPSASKSPAALNAKAKSKPHPNQNRTAADAPHDAPQMPQDKHAHRPKEFVQTSSGAPRRLNDIVLAPPDLFVTGMARRTSTQITNTMNGVGKGGAGVSGKDGNRKSTNPPPPSLLSPAQALQLAAARADAVRRFREVGGGWGTGRG